MKTLLEYINENLFDVDSDNIPLEPETELWNGNKCKYVENDTLFIDPAGVFVNIDDEIVDVIRKLNQKYGIKNINSGNGGIDIKLDKPQSFNNVKLILDGAHSCYLALSENTKYVKNLDIDSCFDFNIYNDFCDHGLYENANVSNATYISIFDDKDPNAKIDMNFKNCSIQCKEIMFYHAIPTFDEKCKINAKSISIYIENSGELKSIFHGEKDFEWVDTLINLSGFNSKIKKDYIINMCLEDNPRKMHCELVHQTNSKFKNARKFIDYGEWKLINIKE